MKRRVAERHLQERSAALAERRRAKAGGGWEARGQHLDSTAVEAT